MISFNKWSVFFLTGLHNASDWSNFQWPHTHIPKAIVFPWPEVYHSAFKMRQFIHKPVPVCDIAGLAAGHAEAFLDWFTVIHQLVLLSNKILLFKYSQSECSFVLKGKLKVILTFYSFTIIFNRMKNVSVWNYHCNHFAGTDAVTYVSTHDLLVIGILSSSDQHLLTHEVWVLINHKTATFHPTGATVAQIWGHLRTVTTDLMATTLEVSFLKEYYLKSSK